jgi:glycerol-3-phosphate acyltransferase PlsY
VLEGVGVCLLAFFAGAIPFSNIAARRTRGVDLRQVGTGTVSGTSLYRVAGFLPLAATGICDIAKGAAGPLLAGDNRPVVAAVAGGLAVAGHNWSPFLRGAGGRGIAPAIGALLVNAWPGVVLLLGFLVVGRLLRHSGLACFLAEVALAPVLALTHGASGALAGGAIAVPMLVKRVLGNGRPHRPGLRAYGRRLLFDHDDVPVT